MSKAPTTSTAIEALSELGALEQRDAFVQRHIGPSEHDISSMLKAVGEDSLDSLIQATVPPKILQQQPLQLPASRREDEVLAELKNIATENTVNRSFIGMGYNDTITPPVILRNVLENPGWYTAYTPYQPEIAQGRLEGLLNFQQMVMDLTGMELANASLLDEATAAAEAMTLCKRAAKKNKSQRFLVSNDCHPQTIAVLQTRARYFNFELILVDAAAIAAEQDYFGALFQYPGSSGEIIDLEPLIAAVHEQGALAVVAADILSLTLLTPPGELGADVVVGSSQRFGIPMGFGGPHAAYFATRDEFKRSTPGRIIGVSVDRRGKPALRMALQTREQHIRREKANSNICTSQSLLAIMSAFYAVYHGAEGLTVIATRVQRYAAILAAGLQQLGFEICNQHYFDTLTVRVNEHQAAINQRALDDSLNLRIVDKDRLGISLDETTQLQNLQTLWTCFSPAAKQPRAEKLHQLLAASQGLPPPLLRRSSFLTHEVFRNYRSETDMLRYLKRLENKDIALDHSMIALGSCTMKLNATAEMIPVTWPEFSNIHPFAPPEQTRGYAKLIAQLEQMLAEATGYDAVSLQPNAGSQGEYAGLLAILRYHASRGDNQRDVCLIPHSAHGTNPASASMAGMRVVIVNCDNDGNVDIDDLRAKSTQHRDNLAAIMVTYPSTHGVFEESIIELCEVIHQHGGQVYVDGANLNALVGIAAPGKFGADVSHLNLHKTFCIPHGGGGPGMGPIGVGAHLQPFLPTNPVSPVPGLDENNDVVSAAPYGSASILPISWAYIALMGGEGLVEATKVAILSANYIAHRLKDHYPILYTGRTGNVAHECIVDVRPIKEASGVSEEDIAKRLIDYGFHAPTMSFPVAGTLMVEPTESESLFELDRFCDALIAIKQEIEAVQSGKLDATDNPLINAPHTLEDVAGSTWEHPYSRELAAYPVESLRRYKYWAPVNRVDNVYGDRNLFCACPAIDSYRETEQS
ncbi:MAG: aminomethyl-transferring glycine dehydrogenase [Pseudomonadales bacterium]